jgi:hypothetical protein
MLACVTSVLAQGTIAFYNRVANSVVAPVYGVDPGSPTAMKTGNTTAGFPAGTVVYNGPKLEGTGFSAQLFAGANAENLAAVTTSLTVFRTGATFAGSTLNLGEIAIAGFGTGSTPTLQLRAWDNKGGTVLSWGDLLLPANADLARGMSATFVAQPLGGGGLPPPNLVGLTSFQLYAVPEPSTFALLGLGALGMMIFRRK